MRLRATVFYYTDPYISSIAQRKNIYIFTEAHCSSLGFLCSRRLWWADFHSTLTLSCRTFDDNSTKGSSTSSTERLNNVPTADKEVFPFRCSPIPTKLTWRRNEQKILETYSNFFHTANCGEDFFFVFSSFPGAASDPCNIQLPR